MKKLINLFFAILLVTNSFSAFADNNSQLLENGGFEDGNTGNFKSRASVIECDSSVFHTGKYSVLVSERTQAWGGIEYDVRDILTEEQAYEASVWLRLPGNVKECHMYLQLELKENGKSDSYPIIASGKVTSDSWVQFKGIFDTKKYKFPLEKAKIYICSLDGNLNNVYADDFSLVKSDKTAEEASPRPQITELPDSINPVTESKAYINWYDEKQTIEGFGASGAFGTANALFKMPNPARNTVLDLLYTTDKGIGLSIVRNMLRPQIGAEKGKMNFDADADQAWLMTEAQKRGAYINMSTVWSPPVWMKTNESNVGGEVAKEHYQDFADYLCDYIEGYKKLGIEIDVISMSNEPNIEPDYDGCRWNAKQITDFVKNYIKPTFEKRKITARFMTAEDMNFSEEFVVDALEDSEAGERIDIVGVHGYSQGFSKLTVTESYNKPIWMTEVLGYHEYNTQMKDGLVWAKRIHEHMGIANVSAWNYWYAASPTVDSNGALIYIDPDEGIYEAPKRLYTIGNYSKFVKPKSVRISATLEPNKDVFITAFKNKTENELTIVAVNANINEQIVDMILNGAEAQSFKAYRTSDTESLKELDEQAVLDGIFRARLAPHSVTTFVAKAVDCAFVPVTKDMKVDRTVSLPALTAMPGSPEIDGEIDEVWATTKQAFTSVWGDGTVNTTGAQSKLRTLWDSDYYYVLFEVTDSQLTKNNPTNYMQDCVEIFLDENNKKTTFYENDDVQYRINFDNEVSYSDYCDKLKFKSATKKTAAGYIVEAAVPLKSIKGEAGLIMGTEFQVTDEVGSAARSIAKWATASGSSYRDTSTFGRLFFVDNLNEDEIKVSINNRLLSFDVNPIMKDERVLVPFRKIMESLGAEVSYDDETHVVISKLKEKTVTLQINNALANVNGSDVELEVPAQLYNGRTLVPIRFVSESLGARVDWDSDYQMVTIYAAD